MDIVTTILSAAKSVGVSGSLMLAVCSHESGNFTFDYAPHDNGSPSYGVCQLKLNSARQLGFKGQANELKKPIVSAKYAALYLKYQQGRYGQDWVKLTAAYNAGSYLPSDKVVGCPRNLKYIKLVQKKLPQTLQHKLRCGK